MENPSHNPELENQENSVEAQEKTTQELLFEAFEREGYVERKKEGDKEYTVVDTDRILESGAEEIKAIAESLGIKNNRDLCRSREDTTPDYFEEILSKKNKGEKLSTVSIIYRALGEGKVVSSYDWEKGKREEKDLFYAPKTKEEAFSIPHIKEKEFYLSPWEVSPQSQQFLFSLEKIPFGEAKLACVIYHPNYGNAYFDRSKNKLMMRINGEDRYSPVSMRTLESYGFQTHYFVSDLENKAPNLLERGLLAQNDFEVTSFSKTRRKESIVSNQGQVMFNRRRIFIGRKYAEKRTMKLNERTAVMISEDEDGIRPTHLFDIDGSVGENKDYVKKKEINFRPFDPSKYFPKRADESDAEFQSRLMEFGEHFMHGLAIADEIAKESEISVYDFTEKEIMTLSLVSKKTVQNKNLKEEIIDFAKKYGKEGIVAFLSIEYGAHLGEKIFKIPEKTNDAERIFSEYAELTRLIDNLEETLNENKEKLAGIEGKNGDKINKLASQLVEGLRRRAKDILLVSSSDNEIHPLEVPHALKSLNMITEVVNGLFEKNNNLELVLSDTRQESKIDGEPIEKSYSFHFSDEANNVFELQIFTRRKKLHKEKGYGQARVNFSIKPVELVTDEMESLFFDFTQKISHGEKESVKRDISVRLDLDSDKRGRFRGLSLDTGRAPYLAKDGSYFREGDILGKLLSIASSSDSHNYDSFSQELSNPENFEDIVRSFTSYIDENYPR